MDKIVLNAERDAVQARTAVMVVIQRAVVIVVMTVRGRMVFGMIATIVVLVGAHGMGGFVGGKHARVQPGKDAEDQKPCEKVAHACLVT
jgi:hypothetical protein